MTDRELEVNLRSRAHAALAAERRQLRETRVAAAERLIREAFGMAKAVAELPVAVGGILFDVGRDGPRDPWRLYLTELPGVAGLKPEGIDSLAALGRLLEELDPR